MITSVYSLVPATYLDSALKAGLERLPWKFVLIESPDARHLVCGPVAEYPYHADLVSRYCQLNDIAAAWERKPDIVEIFSSGVKVCGGGYIRIDLPRHRIKLYGYSTAYGRYRPAHLQEIVDGDAFFEGYQVQIVGS